MKSVSPEACFERHKALDNKLDEMHTDIKTNNQLMLKILSNHLPHITIMVIVSLVISGLALGVKVTELLGWLP